MCVHVEDILLQGGKKIIIIFKFPLNAEFSPGSSPNPQVLCLKRHSPAFTNPVIAK